MICKGAVCFFYGRLGRLFGFCLYLIEANGGLKHKEDIKTLFTDVFDDSSYIL